MTNAKSCSREKWHVIPFLAYITERDIYFPGTFYAGQQNLIELRTKSYRSNILRMSWIKSLVTFFLFSSLLLILAFPASNAINFSLIIQNDVNTNGINIWVTQACSNEGIRWSGIIICLIRLYMAFDSTGPSNFAFPWSICDSQIPWMNWQWRD